MKDVFEILDKIEFFQGQRGGRELWNDKTREVQDEDIADFVNDINYIRRYLQSSVVLSKEQYEALVKTAQGKIGNMKATDFLKACIPSGIIIEVTGTEEQIKQGCKETAEKFLQLAYDRCLEKSFIKKVEKLAKQFGVKVEEDNGKD